MKKILLTLYVIMLITCSSAAANEYASISAVQASTDNSGNPVALISISDNSNSCGGSFNLIYDNTKLKIMSYKTSELLSSYSCFVNLEYGNNTARFSWAGTEELTNGGELFAESFEPVEDGSFETEIVIDAPKLADGDGNRIAVAGGNGKLSYKAESTSSRGHFSGTKKNNTSNTVDEEKRNESETVIFSDIKKTDWFYDYVMSAYESGLMRGISENTFDPRGKLTRAMFITVMHRLSDLPKPEKQAGFTDVDASSWYADAVAWGYENGIIKGISETQFAPNNNITREQIAAILYRYAKYKGIDVENIAKETEMSVYPDSSQVSDWAADAMCYCIASKVINGDGNGNILPKNYASRAEMATIIVRFIQE